MSIIFLSTDLKLGSQSPFIPFRRHPLTSNSIVCIILREQFAFQLCQLRFLIEINPDPAVSDCLSFVNGESGSAAD